MRSLARSVGPFEFARLCICGGLRASVGRQLCSCLLLASLASVPAAATATVDPHSMARAQPSSLARRRLALASNCAWLAWFLLTESRSPCPGVRCFASSASHALDPGGTDRLRQAPCQEREWLLTFIVLLLLLLLQSAPEMC